MTATPIVEQHEAIGERRFALWLQERAHLCFQRLGRPMTECWCIGCGPHRSTPSCPAAVDPGKPAPDPLAGTRERVRELGGAPFWEQPR